MSTGRPLIEIPIRSVGIVVFPGVVLLDVTGPTAVFGFANQYIKEKHSFPGDAYTISVLATQEGPFRTVGGLQVLADESYLNTDGPFDTLLIPGGPLDAVLANCDLAAWIKTVAPGARRLVSVCTGAFLLAESGLLDGHKATTHWKWCSRFCKAYPKVILQADRFFVRDGNLMTSGGVTSGIDLALALVEEDWGQKVASHVARMMVVYLRRPGGQLQFSYFLANEASKRPDFHDLQGWIRRHPKEDLRIEALAHRVAMSSRNFARLFFQQTGITPAKFVEMARVDRARHLLISTSLPIEIVSERSGFCDPERMRRSFLRQIGINPSDYRKRFGKSSPEDSSGRIVRDTNSPRDRTGSFALRNAGPKI
ncbi:MAG: GlxA family transcriptional regulator [Gammaproteobacteria bacterium]